MWQIKDMAEEDKLFNFLAGLQPWAQTELRLLRVKDLPSALAAAEELVDLKTGSSVPDWGDAGRVKDKGKGWKKKASSDPPSDEMSESRFGGSDKRRGCFICDGDHRLRDYQKRAGQREGKLNVVVAESKEEYPRLSSWMLVSRMRVLDEGSDVNEVCHGMPTLEKNLAGYQPSVGHGELTYAKAFASAATSNGRGVPGKLAVEERFVDAEGLARKGSVPATTTTSSNSGGGGVLRG